MSFDRSKIVGKSFRRSAELNRAAADAENRTAELAFSSAAPCREWFGYLVLDHGAGSVNLDRLRATGALLWAHDTRQQIGAVEDIELDEAGQMCRATVRFSRSALGEENWNDVQDGIKRSVSFGFFVNELEPMVGDDGKQMEIDDEPVYISRSWEPYEISLVSVPADISVGVGRELEIHPADGQPAATIKTQRKNNNMSENATPAENPATNANPAPAAATAPTAVAPSAEAQRAQEFIQLGEIYGRRDLALRLSLDPSKSLGDLRSAILADLGTSPATPPADVAEAAQRNGAPATTQLAVTQYRGSSLKAFRGKDGHQNAHRSGMALLAALTGDENAKRYCRDNGIQLTRDHAGRNNATGGFFVIPEMENAIIDLRIQYGVFRANANVTPMISDTKLVNRRVSGLTAVPVGPSQRGTRSDANWNQVELVARKWMVLTKLEDELSEDAVINLADTLANEAAYAFAESEDRAGFLGDGTSEYHGIVGLLPKLAAATASLQTATGNTWASITMNDLLGVVGKLPQFARRSGNVKWYCSAPFWATVMQKLALASGGVTHAEVEGELRESFLGKPVEIVEVMPQTTATSQIPVIYGNLTQSSTFGDRRGVTIKMTDSNDVDFESDIQTLKATERFDINNHDVGSTTAAGPVVALITGA